MPAKLVPSSLIFGSGLDSRIGPNVFRAVAATSSPSGICSSAEASCITSIAVFWSPGAAFISAAASATSCGAAVNFSSANIFWASPTITSRLPSIARAGTGLVARVAANFDISAAACSSPNCASRIRLSIFRVAAFA